MSFLTTIQKLKTILDTISVGILPVKFEYQETMPTSFPSGNIIFAGASERMLDTITNEVTEKFVIRSIFPIEESQTATEKWLTLLDALGTEFRKSNNQTLTGTAVSFQISEYSQPQVSSEFSQPIIAFDIIVTAKILKTII